MAPSISITIKYKKIISAPKNVIPPTINIVFIIYYILILMQSPIYMGVVTQKLVVNMYKFFPSSVFCPTGNKYELFFIKLYIINTLNIFKINRLLIHIHQFIKYSGLSSKCVQTGTSVVLTI